MGLGAVGEDVENGHSQYNGDNSNDNREDTVMGGTQEDEEHRRRKGTPPPMLPEMENIGEGVRMEDGSGETEERGEIAGGMGTGTGGTQGAVNGSGKGGQGQTGREKVRARKRPSGWFGGAGIFEGIR